jgi:uncharacterized membrane protein
MGMAETLKVILSIVVLLGGGITMGVFFAVTVSVSPALAAMTPDRYVEAHLLLGKGYHPAMPIITNATMFAGFGLTVLTPAASTRALFLVSALLVIGVQAVSHLGNVPINRALTAYADGSWTDPRPRWRFWHQIRTTLAAVALVASSLAVALPH